MSPDTARKTPYLTFDTGAAVAAYQRIADALPGTCHYAVKCQPDEHVLAALVAAGAQFEIASAAELRLLMGLGVDPTGLVFSNPAKSPDDIAEAYAAGVRLYAVDSAGEISKLRQHAPGVSVMVRLATQAADSAVGSGGTKFGVSPDVAIGLLLSAQRAGLEAAGICFHVGSQAHDPMAWVRAIDDAGAVMRALAQYDLRLRLLDIGGGFPAPYAYPSAGRPPSVEKYGQVIAGAIADRLPYEVAVISEPGRAVAAAAGTMVAEVWLVAERGDRTWVHLNTGVFHGFMEAMESGRIIPFPTSDSRGDTDRITVTLTGPTCDGQDVIGTAQVSRYLEVRDQVSIGCAGAYTTAYCKDFNGFPTPTLHTHSGSSGRHDRAGGDGGGRSRPFRRRTRATA